MYPYRKSYLSVPWECFQIGISCSEAEILPCKETQYSDEIGFKILPNLRLLNPLANTDFRLVDSLQYIGKHCGDCLSESV